MAAVGISSSRLSNSKISYKSNLRSLIWVLIYFPYDFNSIYTMPVLKHTHTPTNTRKQILWNTHCEVFDLEFTLAIIEVDFHVIYLLCFDEEVICSVLKVGEKLILNSCMAWKSTLILGLSIVCGSLFSIFCCRHCLQQSTSVLSSLFLFTRQIRLEFRNNVINLIKYYVTGNVNEWEVHCCAHI